MPLWVYMNEASLCCRADAVKGNNVKKNNSMCLKTHVPGGIPFLIITMVWKRKVRESQDSNVLKYLRVSEAGVFGEGVARVTCANEMSERCQWWEALC